MLAEHFARQEMFKASRLSHALREHGRVVLHITVGTDGRAKTAAVAQSSGFPRLDETALRAALKVDYKPATRGGIPIARLFSWAIIYPEPL
jgi:periplasmic protein TonB